MAKKYVYYFGGGTADGDGTMKDVLGGKGAGLAEMSRAGVPVPPGFTISTEVCNHYFANNIEVMQQVENQSLGALRKLEREMGVELGNPGNPLLLSVRSGAKFSMPGMMNTILNLGLNDDTTEGLARKTGNPRFAYDCYRRFIQMFGEVALGIDMAKFDHIFDERKKQARVKLDTDLTAGDLKAIVAEFEKLVVKEKGRPFPQNAMDQLVMARDAVFRSWWNDKAIYYRKMERIPDDIGTAASVQAMVFGNMGDHSCTGVGFTRDPGSGEKVFYGEFLINAQGEDVVAGIRTPQPISELEAVMPEVYRQLREITGRLEKHYKDMQDFEFTVQEGKLYMLQTRNGKRTGPAAVRVAVDMVAEGLIDKKTAVLRVAPAQLDQLLHPVFDQKSLQELTRLTTGIAASPGAAVGRIAFSADDAVPMSANAPVILLRKETTPDDIHGMDVSKGILTAVGGKSSHAAVVARGMGRPCIVGAGAIAINEPRKIATVKLKDGRTVTLKEGDWVSLDGTTGDVYEGHAKTLEPDPKSPMFAKFMAYADEFRAGFGVRANADIPRDAKAARAFGAEGIGLCRTEHMFFAEDRIPHMQAMILAREEKARRKALARLLPMQRKDFAGLFQAMDGFPVVIRTLDPPLHEFLPKREQLMVDLARLPHATIAEKREMAERYRLRVGELKKAIPELLHRVEELHEFNPMLGFRGCRLGIIYPEITEMQARAIFEAAVQVAGKGVKVIPEVMIPLVGTVTELRAQKEIVERVAKEVIQKAGVKLKYLIGTMIEVPRAALTADEIAREAEFFSFGTNDLTQTTYGISRDDYTKFVKSYTDQKLWKEDPFAVLDQEGVGKLVEQAVQLGRKARPDLEVGICGEHGGEPSSVEFCYRVGMDYVSCSPYRVPIARLAAAQAAISGDKSETARTA
ncbi:MAG: pyruvate, phosphate dikinase [Acidobacteria bacterium]|nr:pyruvate, phosphate dikinase [Acidobacteriota bacterium]MBI3280941.1 pyruvate, phosphate dikinase [Acidobacteriota bacterium]